MKFSVDPWDPSYGTSLDTEMAASEAVVVVDIEIDPSEWSPCDPAPSATAPDAVIFVDGVRRIEARCWLNDNDGNPQVGIFASYAAGTVRCVATSAKIGEVEVGRGIYSPASGLGDVITKHAMYEAHTARDASPESLMFAVHDDMATAEVEVAERARRHNTDLIVLDGPIRKRGHIPDAIGFVKSHAVRYLPPSLDQIVDRLKPGQRTPLFRIEAQPFSRTSFYLRLPTTSDAPWAGIVRCEATGALPITQLVALADTVCVTVPRFASEAHKDARAPQNLYPIGGLERELRRRLGDQRLLYRALRLAAVEQSATV